MFGKKQITVEIDYGKLAQQVLKLQTEQIQSMDDENMKRLFNNALVLAEEYINKKKDEERTPIGKVSEQLLKDYQSHCNEVDGLEELLSNILERKGRLMHERKILWNKTEVELGKPIINARIDLKTGDIYYIKSEDVEN